MFRRQARLRGVERKTQEPAQPNMRQPRPDHETDSMNNSEITWAYVSYPRHGIQ